MPDNTNTENVTYVTGIARVTSPLFHLAPECIRVDGIIYCRPRYTEVDEDYVVESHTGEEEISIPRFIPDGDEHLDEQGHPITDDDQRDAYIIRYMLANDWVYCSDHWVHKNETSLCAQCNERILNEDAYYIIGSDEPYCLDCANEHSTVCPCCEDRVWNEDTREVRIYSPSGPVETEWWCDSCCEHRAQWNEEDEIYEYWETGYNRDSWMLHHPTIEFPSDVTTAEQKKEWLKTNLFPADLRYAGYHASEHNFFKQQILRLPDENPYMYYGIELELNFNTGESTSTIVEDVLRASGGLFVCEYDRSVEDLGNGAEFISRPLSYQAWTSPQIKEKLTNFFEACHRHHVMDPPYDGTGLHIHTSRRFYEAIGDKDLRDIKGDIDWMFQIFQPEFEKISRRAYSRYCTSKAYRLKEALRRSGYSFNIRASHILERGNCITESSGSGDTHHDAVIQTNKTIEMRTFRSTVKLEELLATIEFVRSLAHAARTMNIKEGVTTLGDILSCTETIYLDEYLKKHQVDLSKKWTNTLEVK